MGCDRRATLALVFAALAFPLGASAQESGRFRLAWARDEGAERCPDGPSIEREVTRRLGHDPFVRSAAPSIEASVRRTDTQWIARIVVRDASDVQVGVREFTSETPDCTAIALAVTLGVALSIDPEAALRPPPPVTPPPPPPPPPPPAVRPPPVPRELVWARAAGLTLRGVAGVGYLPSAGFGVSLAAEGPIKARWRWTLGTTWLPETALTTPAGTFGFSFAAVSLGPCFDVWRARVMSLTACAGPSLGALRAVVRQGAPSNPGDQAWLAIFLSARFRVRVVGPLGAEAGFEANASVPQHRFTDGTRRPDGNDTVFQQSPVAIRAFVGLGLQFQ